MLSFEMRGKPLTHKIFRLSAAILTATFLTPYAQSQVRAPQQNSQQATSDTLRQYCGTCHSSTVKTAGVVIDPAALSRPGSLAGSSAEIWERAVRQLRSKTMPPVGMPRPDAATYEKVASYLETTLDREAAAKPNPGDLPNLHRLTRT